MGFVITAFMMINLFFQRYTIILIILETSSLFPGQIILTVFGEICPSSQLILNVLFLSTQSQFLCQKFVEFAIVALLHILQM